MNPPWDGFINNALSTEECIQLSQVGSSEDLLRDVMLAVDKVQNIINGGTMGVATRGLLLPPLYQKSF